jgi:hypothetical protein
MRGAPAFRRDLLKKLASTFPEKVRKRRQHHVWQEYLKSWTTDGQLYCLRGGHIFRAGTSVVALERNFYKLHELNSDDLRLINRLVIENAHPFAKKIHEDFLNRIIVPTLLAGESVELDAAIDIYRTNVLETYHAGIEASFLPILRMLLRKDIGFYATDAGCINFLHFICTQNMRTKGVKTRTIETIKEKTGQDLSRTWDIISLMLAINAGASLYLERKKRKLTVLDNNTDVTFVTGDQPIINLHGHRPKETAPTLLAFYYPLSPRLAAILSEVDEEPALSAENLTAADVVSLNAKIIEASHSQVFGHSEASIARSCLCVSP